MQVYGLLDVCDTDSTDGAVGLTVELHVLVENVKSLKISVVLIHIIADVMLSLYAII